MPKDQNTEAIAPQTVNKTAAKFGGVFLVIGQIVLGFIQTETGKETYLIRWLNSFVERPIVTIYCAVLLFAFGFVLFQYTQLKKSLKSRLPEKTQHTQKPKSDASQGSTPGHAALAVLQKRCDAIIAEIEIVRPSILIDNDENIKYVDELLDRINGILKGGVSSQRHEELMKSWERASHADYKYSNPLDYYGTERLVTFRTWVEYVRENVSTMDIDVFGVYEEPKRLKYTRPQS